MKLNLNARRHSLKKAARHPERALVFEGAVKELPMHGRYLTMCFVEWEKP